MVEPVYEDMSIWQIAAELDKQLPNEKFRELFHLAEQEYQMHARHNGLSREKQPPLENNTVWGIAAILNMLPYKKNVTEFLQSDGQVPKTVVDIVDDDEEIFDDALKIYCERVNPTDLRALVENLNHDAPPTPPKLIIIK